MSNFRQDHFNCNDYSGWVLMITLCVPFGLSFFFSPFTYVRWKECERTCAVVRLIRLKHFRLPNNVLYVICVEVQRCRNKPSDYLFNMGIIIHGTHDRLLIALKS